MPSLNHCRLQWQSMPFRSILLLLLTLCGGVALAEQDAATATAPHLSVSLVVAADGARRG